MFSVLTLNTFLYGTILKFIKTSKFHSSLPALSFLDFGTERLLIHFLSLKSRSNTTVWFNTINTDKFKKRRNINGDRLITYHTKVFLWNLLLKFLHCAGYNELWWYKRLWWYWLSKEGNIKSVLRLDLEMVFAF